MIRCVGLLDQSKWWKKIVRRISFMTVKSSYSIRPTLTNLKIEFINDPQGLVNFLSLVMNFFYVFKLDLFGLTFLFILDVGARAYMNASAHVGCLSGKA
jgi:hypothetical protein